MRPPPKQRSQGGRPATKDGRPRPRSLSGRRKPAPGEPEPRDLAARLLASIETRQAFSDKLLAAEFRDRSYTPATRGRVTRLVKGVLRRRGEIDALLVMRLRERLKGLPVLMRQILRLGVYQMLDDSPIPRPLVVNETVKLATRYGHPGTVGLTNAVLRALAREGDLEALLPQGEDAESLATRLSHPVWMVERWLRDFGLARTLKVLTANRAERSTWLRPNPFRGGAPALLEALGREKVQAFLDEESGLVRLEDRFAPPDSPAFTGGLATAQDPAEFEVLRLCDPRPGQKWADLCAAPGGKCTGLMERMNGQGRVLALDLHFGRLKRARETAVRLATPNLIFVAADGRFPPLRPGSLDGVLVDAPCSGLGVLARRADARWRKDPSVLETLPPLQKELLEAASKLLGPKGVLVFSVCSFEPEETTQVVEQFLAAHPEYRLQPAETLLRPALVENGYLRILPGEQDMDGAFAARMIRE